MKNNYHFYQHLSNHFPIIYKTKAALDLALESLTLDIKKCEIELHYGNKKKSTLSKLALALEAEANTPSASTPTPNAATPEKPNNPQQAQQATQKAQAEKQKNKGLVRSIISAIRTIFKKITEVVKAIAGFFKMSSDNAIKTAEKLKTEEGLAELVGNNISSQLKNAETEEEIEKIVETIKPGLYKDIISAINDGANESDLYDEENASDKQKKIDKAALNKIAKGNARAQRIASFKDRRNAFVDAVRKKLHKEPDIAYKYEGLKLSKDQARWFNFRKEFRDMDPKLVTFFKQMILDYNNYITELTDLNKTPNRLIEIGLAPIIESGETQANAINKANNYEVKLKTTLMSAIFNKYITLATKYNGPISPNQINETGAPSNSPSPGFSYLESDSGFKRIGPLIKDARNSRFANDSRFREAAAISYSGKKLQGFAEIVGRTAIDFNKLSNELTRSISSVSNAIGSVTPEMIEMMYRSKMSAHKDYITQETINAVVNKVSDFIKKYSAFVGSVVNEFLKMLKEIVNVFDRQLTVTQAGDNGKDGDDKAQTDESNNSGGLSVNKV